MNRDASGVGSGRPRDPRIRPGEIAPGRVTPGRATKRQARVFGLVPVVAAFVVILLAIQFLEEVYEAVMSGGAAGVVDRPLQAWMLAHREDWLDSVATAYTHLGGKIGMPILATAIVLAMAWWWRTRTPVTLMLAATAGSLTMTTQGKTMTARSRPPYEEAVPPLEMSASFPSGHTLNAVVVATVLAYLTLIYVVSRLRRVLTVVGLVCFCALMALSRVYLGHHWLTDVLAGAAAGLAWALAVVLGHWVYVRLRTKDRAPTVRGVAQDHRRGAGSRTALPTAGRAGDRPERRPGVETTRRRDDQA